MNGAGMGLGWWMESGWDREEWMEPGWVWGKWMEPGWGQGGGWSRDRIRVVDGARIGLGGEWSWDGIDLLLAQVIFYPKQSTP